METSLDTVFITLEYDKYLVSLDVHQVRPEEIENKVSNFLLKQINNGNFKVQIIYGRGGIGILREKVQEFLDKNMQEKNQNNRLVKAWKEAVLESAGGRCLVILEG
ncbi:MAG: Smr/MutS family protein [Candidatus Magasanikbacteria bacterium]|nr:Smr/MutS family protein [Candidatus Magasanikbacteria bacterium]